MQQNLQRDEYFDMMTGFCRIDRMFFSSGRKKKIQSQFRPKGLDPKRAATPLSFFFLFPNKNPVNLVFIPSSRPFLSPNQKSRSSLSYPVIPSFLFPNKKILFILSSSCHPVPFFSQPTIPFIPLLSCHPVFSLPQTKIPSILSLSCHPVENYPVNPVQKFNTKTQTSKAGSFDRAHILDCPQRYRRQGQS